MNERPRPLVNFAEQRAQTSGVLLATAAYSLWGILPAFWKLFGAVPALEVLANRVVFALLFTLALLAGLGRLGDLGAALRSTRERRGLALAGAFIGVNWGVFIWAVQAGRIVETSLGYYLNPLITAALAVGLFRERLRPAQFAALALAAVGVAVQFVGHGDVPWIALVLAGSFACYGVAKKRSHVHPLAGLALETAVLAPLALAWLAFGAPAPGGALLTASPAERALLLVAGPITALPLLAFAAAAQRLSLTLLGLFQYLAPTLSLLLAVLAYNEPFTRTHALSFTCIWAALALFSASAWHARRLQKSPAP